MRGQVHSVQSLSTVDGPGVRAVVFLNGCRMRCVYCHNPDTWDVHGGTSREAAEVFAQIKRFQPYFGEKGGLTVSGGEPLLQADFVRELFTLCKERGIHTCLDTAGSVGGSAVESLLAVCDLCLLDIKFTDPESYRRYTSGDLAATLAFLRLTREKNIPVITRHVIVPGLTDTPDYIASIKALLADYPNVQRCDLLPFRKLCADKYRQLHIPFPLENTSEASDSAIAALTALL